MTALSSDHRRPRRTDPVAFAASFMLEDLPSGPSGASRTEFLGVSISFYGDPQGDPQSIATNGTQPFALVPAYPPATEVSRVTLAWPHRIPLAS
jgi:hypothetical protein